jgi:ribosome-associated translation inhibitor RaiA
MHIQFDTREAGGEGLRALVLRRTRFVLRRLVWLVPRVRVQMVDINGPRGGVDKRCQVQVHMLNGTPLVITALATDWRVALDQALNRATRAIRRQWSRDHQPSPAVPLAYRRSDVGR